MIRLDKNIQIFAENTFICLKFLQKFVRFERWISILKVYMFNQILENKNKNKSKSDMFANKIISTYGVQVSIYFLMSGNDK